MLTYYPVMTNTQEYITTNWKCTDERGTLLKIINFPCDYGDFGGESMWVRLIEGTDNDGIGFVCNDPAFSSLRYGDVIAYAGGTDDTKAHYTGRAVNVFEYDGSPQREYLKEVANETPELQQFNGLMKDQVECGECGDPLHQHDVTVGE
tara:strand:- start:1050 stop:1496 length:447 start_codon:yes stop_codon:yes gene_type:complete